MIIGIGVDVLSNDKLTALLAKHPGRAQEVIFRRSEWSHQGPKRSPVEEYRATRFAAKEATLKALGIHDQVKYELNDIEIVGTDSVTVILHNRLAEYAKNLGIVCLRGGCTSHHDHSVAFIIGEG